MAILNLKCKVIFLLNIMVGQDFTVLCTTKIGSRGYLLKVCRFMNIIEYKPNMICRHSHISYTSQK